MFLQQTTHWSMKPTLSVFANKFYILSVCVTQFLPPLHRKVEHPQARTIPHDLYFEGFDLYEVDSTSCVVKGGMSKPPCICN